MASKIGTISIGVLAVAAMACGSGNTKVNYAKVDATKRVAVVGVCQLETVVAARGTQTENISIGSNFIDPFSEALAQAFASTWKNVEVVPLSKVAGQLSPRSFKRRLCASGHDPLLAKGFAGDADKAYMRELAQKLGVDAVVAVTQNVGLRLDGEPKAKFFAGTFNPIYVYVVDKSGEEIANVSMKGLDGEYADDFPTAAASYARVVTQEFAKRLAAR